MSGIFISYRRTDTAGYAGRLAEELRARFGRSNVFMDVDTIPGGNEYVEHVRETLARCAVTLVLIGDEWLDRGPDGTRRIDDETDLVRREIAWALAHPGGTVIPVVVERAPMPSDEDL